MKLFVTHIARPFVLVAAAALCVAQTPPAAAPPAADTAATPSVDDVLNHYIQALGGRDAIAKFTSTTEKGTFEVPDFGVSGPMEIYNKTGDKTFMTIDIAGFGTVRRGYDGTTGWADDPQAGLRDLAGDELADMKRNAVYNSELRMKDVYPGLTVKGSDKVNGHDAWILETSIDELKHRFYFDSASWLLVRTDEEVKVQDGKGTAVMYLADYKTVDGVQVPCTMTMTSPQMNFNMKISDVKHNDPIDDAKFVKPSGEETKPAEAAKPAEPAAKPAEATPGK